MRDRNNLLHRFGQQEPACTAHGRTDPPTITTASRQSCRIVEPEKATTIEWIPSRTHATMRKLNCRFFVVGRVGLEPTTTEL
jgi:hypothetical protein